MKRCSGQKGFSLIELLLVVVIIGLLATIAVPSLLKSRDAAEKAAAIGVLHTMHINQTGFFTHKARYALLNELNSYSNNTLGTSVGSTLIRGNYTYFLFPSNVNSLKTRYIIIAVKYRSQRAVSAFYMDQDGQVWTLIE